MMGNASCVSSTNGLEIGLEIGLGLGLIGMTYAN